MKRIGLVLLITVSALVIFCANTTCAQEEKKLITYYPSPYGVYKELTTTENTSLATKSGSVVIGTENPNTLLDIKSTGTPTLTVQTSAPFGQDAIISIKGARTTSLTADVAQLEFWNNEESLTFQMAEISARNADPDALTSNSDLVFKINDGTNLREVMRIDDAGNVGIGTSDPTVKLHCKSDNSIVIYGENTTNNIGVYGSSLGHFGVLGVSTGSFGVFGQSTDSFGVFGQSTNSYGVFAKSTDGEGLHAESTNDHGIYASSEGDGKHGVYGFSTNGRGVYGQSSDSYGVYGLSPNASGVYGTSANSYGVHGVSTSSCGVYGRSNSDFGVLGWSINSHGVVGKSNNSSAYDFYAHGDGADYGSSSSIRWKNNIELINNALDKVRRLRGIYFDWIKEKGGHHDLGMIAEEVGEVFPEIVVYEPDGSGYASGMDYSKLTPILVEAIKEQQNQIENLRIRNQELEGRIKALEEELK